MASLPLPTAPARRLLDFIASKEAPKGYDTVFRNRMADMPRPLTSMTLNEVIAQGKWRTDTFGSSACGRYQFMKRTLQNLKAALRLTGSERFNADLQDRLGYKLLLDRGFARFIAGSMSVTASGLALAQEWASFPVLAATKGEKRQVSRGQSFYAGDGLNKALVSADAVEQALRGLLSPSALGIAEVEALERPRVDTVVPPPQEDLPWWARLFVKKKPPAVARPGLHPNGDPELYDVQKALRDRAYYTKGKLDGLDGPLTQEAVAQARKDNGLGDRGVDTPFLAALPGFPLRPVSAERLAMPITEAAKQRPEVFSPVKWLGSVGLGAIGLGGADGSGLLDNLQATAGKANDVLGTAQTAIGTVSGIVAFVVEHRAWFFVGLGLFLLLKAVGWGLDAWIKVRRAFF